jgi:hypothetical protein
MDGANSLTWRDDVLPRAAKDALEYLSGCHWLKQSEWYLAGGTALALQAGHRQSVDLDFFSRESFEDVTPLLRLLPAAPVFVVDHEAPGTLYGRLREAKTSFISYPFFTPREPLLPYGCVGVLSERDIAAMKIIAISQRGKKRDFIDLYWYIRYREPLLDVCRRLPAQYPSVRHNYQHIAKALMYFADAEDDPTPKLFFDADWASIKDYFQKETPRVAKTLLGIG